MGACIGYTMAAENNESNKDVKSQESDDFDKDVQAQELDDPDEDVESQELDDLVGDVKPQEVDDPEEDAESQEVDDPDEDAESQEFDDLDDDIDSQELDDLDDDVELDKIVLPESTQQIDASLVSEDPTVHLTGIEPELEPGHPKRQIAIIAVAVISILVILSLATLMTSSRQETAQKVGPYQKINPIITNIGENRHIKISLLIRTAPATKKAYDILETRIRDGVLTFLASTEIKKITQLEGRRKMEAAIHNELTVFLKKKYMNRTLIREVKVYN